MRTTISIQDALLEEAKDMAHQRKCTLGKVIEEALRESFSRKAKVRSATPTPLPTYRGKGLSAGVNLNSNADLLDVMEE